MHLNTCICPIIVNSVSPSHEQSNHSNINHFEQVFHSLIANNLSPIRAFSKNPGSLQQKRYDS